MNEMEPPLSVTGADAIDYAFDLIRAAPAWRDPRERSAFFIGLTDGWMRDGVINNQQRAYLRDQLETALRVRADDAAPLDVPDATRWRRFLAWCERLRYGARSRVAVPCEYPITALREVRQSLPAQPQPAPPNTR